jgi:hypothetical protein
MDPTTQVAAVGAFFDLKHLLTYQNVLVVIAAWNIIEMFKRMAPDFWRSKFGARVLVLMPMLVCQALVWGTVKWQPAASWGERVLLGLVLAFLTAHAHDVLKRFGLHEYVPVFGRKLNPPERGTTGTGVKDPPDP